jgi:hypothetical protein
MLHPWLWYASLQDLRASLARPVPDPTAAAVGSHVLLTSGALGRTYPPPHHQQQYNGGSAQPQGRGTRSSAATPSTDVPQQAVLPQHASSAAAAWLDSDDTSLQSLQEALPAQAQAPAVTLQSRRQGREEVRQVQQAAGVCVYGVVQCMLLL